MSEREPWARLEDGMGAGVDEVAIAWQLDARVEEIADPALGLGRRFRLRAAHRRSFDLYPEAMVVHLATGELELTLAQIALLIPAPGKPLPKPAERDAVPAPAPPSSEDEPDRTSTTPPSPASSAEREQRQRPVLTGRIGRAPELRELPTGKHVARFPLAVHDGEATAWHTVVAFNTLAERTAERYLKGQTVTVIGYPHERTVTNRYGKTKRVTELFAAAIRTPKEAKETTTISDTEG